MVPEPTPGAGEVRVRLEVIGINYAEVLSRQGLYGWAPALPYTGMEGAGVIDDTGRASPSTPGSASSSARVAHTREDRGARGAGAPVLPASVERAAFQ
jgi:NADPH:quinone reductase-like Zn-dependent oxidoreductase